MTDPQSLFETAHALMRQSSGGDHLTKAAEMMKQAADAGHAGAANNYGALLQHGRGVPLDLAQSRHYYEIAARAGSPVGQFNYGFMWLHGHGGDKDTAEARRWFLLAAEHNEADALTHLGRMAMIGEGGAQDFQAAYRYWTDGALEAGDSRCAFNIGIASAGGHGAPPSFAAALAWFKLAEALGNKDAAPEIAKITRVMTEAEQGDAHDRYCHIRANCDAFN
jgi:TPR repeat protein